MKNSGEWQDEHDELNRKFDGWGRKQDCLHDGCPECHGSGRKKNGEICVHWISCPCPKCTPTFMAVD